MLMLFEPAFETKRLVASAVAQTAVAVVTPAQRENARPDGLVPTCTQYPGAPTPQGLGLALGNGVRTPLPSYENPRTWLVALFATYRKLPLAETASADGFAETGDAVVCVGTAPTAVNDVELMVYAETSPDC